MSGLWPQALWIVKDQLIDVDCANMFFLGGARLGQGSTEVVLGLHIRWDWFTATNHRVFSAQT